MNTMQMESRVFTALGSGIDDIEWLSVHVWTHGAEIEIGNRIVFLPSEWITGRCQQFDRAIGYAQDLIKRKIRISGEYDEYKIKLGEFCESENK